MIAFHLVVLVGLGLRLGAEPARQIELVGSDLALDVDSGTGTFTRIQHPASGVSLASPLGMAENFRLTLLRPDKTTATILGKEQTLSRSELRGEELALTWNAPLSDTSGGKHDISVQMKVLAEKSGLRFGLCLENHTAAKVQEVRYPVIGGLMNFASPGKPGDATLWVPTSTPLEKSVKPGFGTNSYAYPGQMTMSFCSLGSRSLGRSVYFASEDPLARYKVYDFREVAASGGPDVSVCVLHSPFTAPNSSFAGSPVVLRFVDGDWRAAGQVYRRWFESTFGISQPSDNWIRRQSFFLMTMFMLPEGTINFTFRDIPKWAKSAKDHGINAVQISGWQMGGHDNGYPDYSIDPRLGTWEELEAGIRACHKMGVKVFFFVNYQPMMVDSSWYKGELSKYREMTADGGHTWMAGWGMGTLWARMGHPKLMTWADLAFPQFRKIIVDQFSRLAQIGGDGVHVDKMFPTALDYNPDIPMSPDTATWEGAILLTQEVLRECRKHNPDWAMSFECNWDRMLQFTGATWWVGNQLITRQVFPEHAETLGLYQAYDFLGVNNAVRGGHIVMVAPLNFSRSLDWPPFKGLANYIKEVKRLRDQLQDAVFYGEVLGQNGVELRGPPPDGVEYNVFRNRVTGQRVCVLTNSRMEARQVTLTAFEGAPGARARVHTPFAGGRALALPAEISVPGERVVFVEELGGKR